MKNPEIGRMKRDKNRSFKVGISHGNPTCNKRERGTKTVEKSAWKKEPQKILQAMR